MARYHLRFKHFRAAILDATEEFFGSYPWRTEGQFEKFQKWVKDAAEAYGVPVPTIRVYTEEELRLYEMQLLGGIFGFGELNEDLPPLVDIPLNKFSVLTTFFQFRLHALRNGVTPANENPLEDAAGWSASLFYKFRPQLFRKAVRSGRVQLPLHPEDLLSSESMEKVRQLRLDGRMEEAERVLMGAPIAELSEEEASTFEEIVAVLSIDEEDFEDGGE